MESRAQALNGQDMRQVDWQGRGVGERGSWQRMGKVPEHRIPIPPIFATFNPSSSLALSERFLKCHCTERSNAMERLVLEIEVQCWVPHSCAESRYWPGVAPLVDGSWGSKIRDPKWGYRIAESGTLCVFGGGSVLTAQGKSFLPNMELFQCLTTNAAILAHASWSLALNLGIGFRKSLSLQDCITQIQQYI